MAGDFGIDVPDGDPGALETAAADLRSAAGVLGRVATTLQASGSVSGWSGIASMTFESACVNDAAVAAAADGSLQIGALILGELADALRIATRQAEDALEEAREADRRRRDAEDDETVALRSAALADLDAEAAAYETTLRLAAGEPALDARDRQYAAEREAATAREAAAAARDRAARAQTDLEEAQRRGRRVVRRYHEYADGAAGRLAGLAGMAPTVTALPPPPAPAGDGGGDDGNVLTGLGKGFTDLWNEGKGLVTGGFNHVNVFDQDQWQDTWSNDWDIANAIYDDPLGSGEAVLSGMWAPIQESYEHGGVDEAAARAVPSIAGTILGGKGLTKLKELQHVDDVKAPTPSDTPKVIPGGEAPDGSFIPEVLEGDHLPLTARPEPGQELSRVYGQPGDERGLVPMEPHEYARPGGRSYTPERIEDMADPRDHLGLPDVNGGRFVIHGELVDVKDVLVRHALPLDGTRGGAVEYLIPDPAGQVRVVVVEGVNPPH